MFTKIFLFEIRNRIRRPAVWLYFLAVLIFTAGTFATGSLHAAEKEHINSPWLIAFWCSAMTMMMMWIASPVMGTALYRDIEYNTRDYYLTYPITKAGYFWGRYLGSFVFMIFIASGILFGILIGSRLGPAMGWEDAAQYGPNDLLYYLQPFVTIALPNILFVSSLFFGLVAITRNVKVIYFGGILLFLGYFLSVFFLQHTNNQAAIILSDPFALSAVRLESSNNNSITLNTTLLPLNGRLLVNRLIWGGAGLLAILITYLRFRFETFFSGRHDRARIDEEPAPRGTSGLIDTPVSFSAPYARTTLKNLTRLELMNIIRDNYFWFIIGTGTFFLGFVFWMGASNYGVPEFPRTVRLLDIFNTVFPFFIFFILLFYTGETLHRDRATRYAFINDSLPPPNWVMNGSKLITLLLLGLGLSLIPVVTGIVVQALKGYFQFHPAFYGEFVLFILLPQLLEVVVLCYLVHVLVNNKFVAHAVAATVWILLFFLRSSGVFDYNLLLYSYTPPAYINDMNGLAHMIRPVSWFNLYWSLGAGLLVIVAALFFYRGVGASFKERLRQVGARFDKPTRRFTLVLLIAFLGVGAYNYYNVSVLNEWLTKGEQRDRGILYEKTLKHYDSLALPTITGVKMDVDLYPYRKQVYTHAWVSVVNREDRPVSQMLLDADGLTDYTLMLNGKPVPYTSPLIYSRPMLSFFRPAHDTSDFRLYTLDKGLAPGDSALFEIRSQIVFEGFRNDLYAQNLLDNGTFFTGGLPNLGYDDDDEIRSPYERKRAGLPPRNDEEPRQDDPVAMRTLRAGKHVVLFPLDLIVSAPAGQQVVAAGNLVRSWQQDGRNMFHYVQDVPGMYPPMSALCARLVTDSDSVMVGGEDAARGQQVESDSTARGHKVYIDVLHDPWHGANVARFIRAYQDALRCYSAEFGDYPFDHIRLAETNGFGPRGTSQTTFDSYSENNNWQSHFTDPGQFDFLSFNLAKDAAQQWWRFKVAPNATIGSLVIPEGLSLYSALTYWEEKVGPENMRGPVLDRLWFYLFIRHHLEDPEHPVLTADKGFEFVDKAGVVLYGLRKLIGAENMNRALRDFENAFAFKKTGPYAGAPDLLAYLKKYTPDSLQYYLADTWERVTMYDNRVSNVTVHAIPAARPGGKPQYQVDITVSVDKTWLNKRGEDVPAGELNDYIDIGVFGKGFKAADGTWKTNPLYVKRFRFTRGSHAFSVTLDSRPASVAIDPYGYLIDRKPDDNYFTLP